MSVITVANGTRVYVTEKEGKDIKAALDEAVVALGSEKVIMIREEVMNLDANTILDHSKYYYIAQYE